MKAKKINGVNPFKYKWGETAEAIAEREGVSPTSIFMRVSKYGTPYQRRAKPTYMEAKYGKTEVEIAEELNMHPQSLIQREKKWGDVYEKGKGSGQTHRRWAQENWRELPKYQRKKAFWLMQEHPDYARAREGNWNG